MADTGSGSAESPWRPNSLRRLWRAIAAVSALVTAVLLAAATLVILSSEPRLFTLREVVPPDEALVTAFLPAAVLLALSIAFAFRWRGIPAAVQLRTDGFSVSQGRSGARSSVPWAAVVGVSTGSGWEGRQLKLADGRRWFLSVELAEAVEAGWRAAVHAPSAP